jgi:hypothetical protein
MSNLEQNQDIGIDCLHSLNQRLETGKVLLVDHHLILSGKSVVGNSQGFDDDYPPLSLCKLYIPLDGPLGDLATNCIMPSIGWLQNGSGDAVPIFGDKANTVVQVH